MGTNITTVSISDEDKILIEQYNLSPSALIKEALAEFRKINNSGIAVITELQRKIAKQSEIIDNQLKEIEQLLRSQE
jgi:hypothetical protein